MERDGGVDLHFIAGVVGAAADDVGGAVALDGDGVLADGLEPGELDGAGADAVDALPLVSTNDHVADRGALLENEDGIVLTC